MKTWIAKSQLLYGLFERTSFINAQAPSTSQFQGVVLHCTCRSELKPAVWHMPIHLTAITFAFVF